MPRKIYAASSWRNQYQPEVVKALREAGHEVYDFRNPAEGVKGFQWTEVDPQWQQWTTEAYIELLDHPASNEGYRRDYEAMKWADTCVLILPAGRSANLEAGWFAGARDARDNLVRQLIGHVHMPYRRALELHVYMPEYDDPDLMYKLADSITVNISELIERLK